MNEQELEAYLDEAAELFYDESDPENGERAFAIFSELSEMEYELSYLYMGLCYLNGRGTEQDYEKAREFFTRGTEIGNIQSALYLGCCFYDGLGGEPDHAEGYRYFRLAAEYGAEEAEEILKQVEFTAEEKEPFETELAEEPLLTEEELEEQLELAQKGRHLAEYKLGMYHLNQAKENRSREELETALDYLEKALYAGLDIAAAAIESLLYVYTLLETLRIARKVQQREQKGELPLTEDGLEANAVVVNVFGDPTLAHIEDFSTYEGMGTPIGCNRLDIVSTRGMQAFSKLFGNALVGYVDRNGQAKELLNNSIMSSISGYDYLAGSCIICGFESDAVPLTPRLAQAVVDWLSGFAFLDRRIFRWARSL